MTGGNEVQDQPPPQQLTNHRRPRGRPAGSKNKPKPPIIITRDSANSLKAHAMEITSGGDITESLTTFARQKQRGICVLSAAGCVADVALRNPSAASSVVTLHGRFEILSLQGSILPPPAPPGVAGLTVYLAGAQGQVVGGSVAGTLVASGPVVVMAATFMNAAFDRLPLDGGGDMEDGGVNEQHCQNGRVHQVRGRVGCVDVVQHHEVYGIPQNLITNGAVPVASQGYAWAAPPKTVMR